MFQSTTPSPNKSLENLGDGMYKFAMASWISLAGFVILVIFAFASIFQMVMNEVVDFTSFTIFIIAGIALGIFVLVRYIQYILKLKYAAEETRNDELLKAYKMTLGVIITNITAPILLFLLFRRVFTVMIQELTYDPYLADVEQLYAQILGPIITMALAGLLFYIIVAVFQILSANAFFIWSRNLSESSYGRNDIMLQDLRKSAENMKIGQIIQAVSPLFVWIPIIGNIGALVGPILYLVGLGKTGKYIRTYFSAERSQTPQFASGNIAPPTYSNYGSPNTIRPIEYGHNSIEMNKTAPVEQYAAENHFETPLRHCPSCGAPLPENVGQFCAMCGKKLR